MFKFIKSLFMPKGIKTTAGELAKKLGLELRGDEKTIIRSIAPIMDAKSGQLSFYSTERNSSAFKILPIEVLKNTRASIILIQPEQVKFAPKGATLLITKSPRSDIVKILAEVYAEKPRYGIHFGAYVERRVYFKKKKSVYIGQFATVERGAVLGADVKIYPGAFIGRNVVIGNNTIIHSGAHIENATIGDDCVINANAVIGKDGFGYTRQDGKNIFIPHVGRVVLGNRVSIGSCACVDRGAMTDTKIGDGTKIDNLVQIAHGVVIGSECFVAALAGIAGGTTVGDRTLIGGLTGIANGVKIGDDAEIGAHSGVFRTIPSGERWMGTPAGPGMEMMRHYAWLRKNVK